MTKNGIRRSTADVIFDVSNVTIMLLILLIMVYPIYFIIIASFSSPQSVATGKVLFWVDQFTTDSYRYVFQDSRIWTGYRNSIVYTIVGTCWDLMVMVPAAYALSKKDLPGRRWIMYFFFITMYFGGGLIPTYLLHDAIGWINTPWILMFAGGVSCYYLIITRTYYENSIPAELYEAARIDGCTNIGTFLRIALPLSKPIIAVMALYYSVGAWNNWFSAYIYVSNPDYAPLQLVLRRIIIDSQTALNELMLDGAASAEDVERATKLAQMGESMKYSTIFIASLPLLCIYPFIQKYFVKGVMIGSVKG